MPNCSGLGKNFREATIPDPKLPSSLLKKRSATEAQVENPLELHG
jgi:hypothetical protein